MPRWRRATTGDGGEDASGDLLVEGRALLREGGADAVDVLAELLVGEGGKVGFEGADFFDEGAIVARDGALEIGLDGGDGGGDFFVGRCEGLFEGDGHGCWCYRSNGRGTLGTG